MGENHERRWNFWHWLGLATFIYLLPFVAILIDAWFLDGGFYQSLGLRAQSTIGIIYWPIIEIAEYLARHLPD